MLLQVVLHARMAEEADAAVVDRRPGRRPGREAGPAQPARLRRRARSPASTRSSPTGSGSSGRRRPRDSALDGIALAPAGAGAGREDPVAGRDGPGIDGAGAGRAPAERWPTRTASARRCSPWSPRPSARGLDAEAALRRAALGPGRRRIRARPKPADVTADLRRSGAAAGDRIGCAGMSEQFVPLAERIIDELLAGDPGAGRRRRRPPLRRPAARPLRRRGGGPGRDAARRVRRTVRCGHRRPRRGRPGRPRAAAVAWSSGRCSQLTEVREHEWNPLAHNPGALLHALLARPFAPADERLEALAGRLAAIPDALATARAVLRRLPADPPGDRGRPVPRHRRVGPGRGAGAAGRGAGAVRPLWSRSRPTRWPALESFADWLRRAGRPRRRRAATRGWAAGCGRRSSGTPSTPS